MPRWSRIYYTSLGKFRMVQHREELAGLFRRFV